MSNAEFKVLLIDDDEDDQAVIRSLLLEAYAPSVCRLEWIPTYDAALEAVFHISHDVCLLDYRLGKNDGLQFLREAVSRGYSTPVIMLTGYGDHDTDVKAMEAGVAGFLSKDELTPELLERSIRYAIRHRQGKAALSRELARAVDSYRNLAANLPGIVYRAHFEEKRLTVFYNDMLESLTGFTPEELPHGNVSPLESVILPEDLQNVADSLDRALKADGVFKAEYRFRHKDGSIRHAVERCKVVKGDDGAPLHMDGVIFDISERKLMEGRLLQAQKLEAIGTLAGGIAHDFNNILSAIIGYSEMFLDDTPETHPGREDIEQILKAGRRGRDLVRQIMDFSREERLQERAPVEIGPIVEEVVSLLRTSLPATVEIRENISRGDIILADATQIHQMVVNLCTNAVHAMRAGDGVLEIGLAGRDFDACSLPPCLAGRQPGTYIELTVTDTGDGMDAATLERIFDPYFTTKGSKEGNGLGLAVVHGIVKRHDGAVTVHSEPGKGTTFQVFFPSMEGEAPEQAEPVREVPTGDERILIVDDEMSIAAMLARSLENLGYAAASVTGSKDALEMVLQEPLAFDLVITDFSMPHMNGLELTRELLRHRPDLPIILCTGFGDLLRDEDIFASGIRAFLAKPVPKWELAQAVRRVLDREPHPADASAAAGNILIIDDDELTRGTVRKMLEHTGYTIFTAPDGERGLQICAGEKIDIVITDIFMPDKDGLETIRELGEHYPRIKVIAISGGGATGNYRYLAAARAFGAVRTIEKPFTRQQLLTTLAELVS